eukprot:504163_1
MSQLWLLLCLLLLIPLNAQNCVSEICTDYICIINSSASANLDGVYKWAYWDTKLKGSAYYNSINNRYIYPTLLSSRYYYHIGRNVSKNRVSGHCNIGPAQTNYIFNLQDCIGKWKSYRKGEFALDPAQIVTSCQDVCSSGHYFSYNLEGTYIFHHYNTSARGNVYYCQSCGKSGAYLHPYTNMGTYYWLFGPDYTSSGAWIRCIIGTHLPVDYVFDLHDCIHKWEVWNDNISQWQNKNIITAKCNYNFTSNYNLSIGTATVTNPPTSSPTRQNEHFDAGNSKKSSHLYAFAACGIISIFIIAVVTIGSTAYFSRKRRRLKRYGDIHWESFVIFILLTFEYMTNVLFAGRLALSWQKCQQHGLLYIALCMIIPYVISILHCVVNILKWKNNSIDKPFISIFQYNKYLLLITCFGCYYGSIALFNSDVLFYSPLFNMPFPSRAHHNEKQIYLISATYGFFALAPAIYAYWTLITFEDSFCLETKDPYDFSIVMGSWFSSCLTIPFLVFQLFSVCCWQCINGKVVQPRNNVSAGFKNIPPIDNDVAIHDEEETKDEAQFMVSNVTSETTNQKQDVYGTDLDKIISKSTTQLIELASNLVSPTGTSPNDKLSSYKQKQSISSYTMSPKNTNDINPLLVHHCINADDKKSVQQQKYETKFKWQWYSGSSGWKDYDEKVSSQIDEAYIENITRYAFKIKNNHTKYEIDFARMKQCNLDTNKLRVIRRVKTDEPNSNNMYSNMNGYSTDNINMVNHIIDAQDTDEKIACIQVDKFVDCNEIEQGLRTKQLEYCKQASIEAEEMYEIHEYNDYVTKTNNIEDISQNPQNSQNKKDIPNDDESLYDAPNMEGLQAVTMYNSEHIANSSVLSFLSNSKAKDKEDCFLEAVACPEEKDGEMSYNNNTETKCDIESDENIETKEGLLEYTDNVEFNSDPESSDDDTHIHHGEIMSVTNGQVTINVNGTEIVYFLDQIVIYQHK